jgi:hypothetical protein
MSEISDEQKRLNRVNRVLSLIEANARLATPGRWSLDHGQVVKMDFEKQPDGTIKDKSFDIACQPWERRMAVRGVNPDSKMFAGFPDMRHIATCSPITMLQLVEDIRAILELTTTKT